MSTVREIFSQARALVLPDRQREYSVKLGPEVSGTQTWFGFDSDGLPTAFLENKADERIKSAKISQAVVIRETEFTDVRSGRHYAQAIQIQCLDTSLEQSFTTFLDLVLEILASGADVHAALAQASNKLRKLLLLAQHELSETKALGLFGELSFLRLLVAHHGTKAITWWTGPSGRQHDFTSDSAAVEVKTSSFQNRSEVSINGLKQLMPLQGCALTLAVADVDRGTGQTILELLDSFAELGVTYAHLEEPLTAAGYSPNMRGADLYRFNLTRWRFWNINAQSPVLSQSTVPDEVVEAVGNVSYSLHLGALGQELAGFDSIPLVAGKSSITLKGESSEDGALEEGPKTT